MPNILRDLRFAVRTLLSKHLSLTLIATLTLALGIGANTAILSVVRGVLLQPLPFSEPERLVRLYHAWDDEPEAEGFVTAPGFVDFRNLTEVFDGLACVYTYNEIGNDLTGGDLPERVSSTRVSSGFFEVLGFRPLLGRTFHRDEERPGVRVTVISHRLWQRRFEGDPAIVGSSLTLDGEPTTVLGVMPADFRMPIGREVDLWTPQDLQLGGWNNRRNNFLSVVGRLRSGVTLGQAQAALKVLAARLAEEYPDSNSDRFARLVPLHEDVVGRTRPMLYVLWGAVALVLLIACLNVANLLLVHGAGRERELAVRAALGSGRWGLARQLLTESLVLAVLGGVAGAVVAFAGIRALLVLRPDALPRIDAIAFDAPLFVLSAALTLGTGLVFGLAPAWQAGRVDLDRALRQGGRGGGAGVRLRRLRHLLVIVQVALALMLSVGAGLLTKSFVKLSQVHLGFRTEGITSFQVHLPDARYGDAEDRVRFYQGFFDKVESLPGVQAVGAISKLPASGRYHDWGFRIEGRPEPAAGEERPAADMRCVDGKYFEAMGIPLMSGRLLGRQDRADSPLSVVVNETLARKYWPGGGDPLGERVRVGREFWTIVGVIGDTRHARRETSVPRIYLPHGQFAANRNWSLTQVVRATVAVPGLMDAVRRQLAELDPQLIVHRVRPLTAIVDGDVARERFAMLLMAAFAATALILAAVGLYGLLTYFVQQRRREIGIRMALGARSRHVRRLVAGQGLALTVAGLAFGLAGAVVLSRWLASLVFEIPVTDPATFVTMAGLLLAVAVVAGLVPVRRAVRVEPLEVLRYE
ncbi:MAG: ABC transporter permease [Thermoanaerobaculia bacterium]